MTSSVKRTGPGSTTKLLAALAPLARYGFDPTQQAIVGFGRFPVAGDSHWSDDWWMPRFGPVWRLHEGLDLFAAYGTPVRAPVDGVIAVSNGGLGGLGLNVRQPDHTYWYLAHLSALTTGIADGVSVKTGQVIGFVGDSGDAKGGAPHVHFEIHPRGGAAVPPKPVIDRFVADALALVPQLLDAYDRAYRPGQPTPSVVPPVPVQALTVLTPTAALLWATAANPAGGTLRLVEADAVAAADRIDWGSISAAEAERAGADEQARRWLAPLVPRPLALAAGLLR